jgi:hypothetical protein
MTFVDRPLPAGLSLPNLRGRNPNSLANLTSGEGRMPGTINKISKDLKEGIIEGAVVHGYDGKGEGGLYGYLAMCAAKFPKAYLQLLGRLLPMQVRGDGPIVPGVNISIMSVDSGTYLTPETIAKLQSQSPGQEITQEPPQQVAPAVPEAVPIASEEPPFEPRSVEEERLLAKLNAMSHEQLMELATQYGLEPKDGSKLPPSYEPLPPRPRQEH